MEGSTSVNRQAASIAYAAQCRKTRKVMRRFRKDRDDAKIRQAAKSYHVRPKSFWRTVNDMKEGTRATERRGSTNILWDAEQEELTSDPMRINDLWSKHFRELAKDPYEGCPRKHSYSWHEWIRKAQMLYREDLPGLNDDLTMDEVIGAIKDMEYHKSPGEDGIPAEFLHLAARKSDSGFADTLITVMQKVFDSGVIPEDWLMSTVVAIPKSGGDPPQMNDHREISLMPTVLKLLISLLARRLYKACEGTDTFHKGQGGFRSKEECVLQVAALHDIKKRRDKKGHRTHMLFVDIQKAYDTVPHHLLFMKLRYYGVRGKYSTSSGHCIEAPCLKCEVVEEEATCRRWCNSLGVSGRDAPRLRCYSTSS